MHSHAGVWALALYRAYQLVADQVAAFDLPPGCQLIILSVDFVSITATPTSKSIDLKWETANEISSKGFELQRKGETGDFTTITTISGKGGTGNNTYTYNDVNVQPNVRYFYRVVETGLDNKKPYSKTVPAIINRPGAAFVQAYPNLVSDEVSLKFSNGVNGTVVINVTDIAGRILYTNSTKNFNGNNIKLDVSKYSAGAYFIKVTNKDLSEVIRIIKR